MSTNTFQGRDNERNSSRVLKPPGGGSSDLFGTGSSQTAAESANQSKSKQTSSNIFGDPYDPVRDVRRSDVKAATEHEQKKQDLGQFETPAYVKAEKPQEDTQSKLFGDHSNQSRRTGKGQGEEFPVYDRSVYAAQMFHQKTNAQRASSYNPITGETYTGSEEVDEQPAHGKRKGGQNLGAYNPITGEEYREIQVQEAASNGDGPQKVRNSSKVLAPPGGKSSGIF
ncbi:microtubule-associated protein Jupiter-like isoform X2 [Mizuhopecten yessoensis]|uniref:Microtubule-associated protein Jupiter n=1 Tax=Mizuhopecten yessoensis TaxID=6573 RepID=A0A210QAN4_MIZYE|nr:microtubule-associated protein Jupiter-like isoform X2 [Mizuhopecten yessoensis]OWF45789.1 Microtubule-associated protein Jupiter [Mizuhopecten yessoensis]